MSILIPTWDATNYVLTKKVTVMQKQVGRVQIKTGRSRIYNFTCVTAVAICCPLYGRLQSLKYKRDCKVSVVSNLCSLPISILHILIFNIFHFQLWAQGDGRHGRHGSFSGAWVRSRGDVEAARIKDSSEAMVGVAIVSSRSHVLNIRAWFISHHISGCGSQSLVESSQRCWLE